jgi:hypothetical protein
MESRTKIGLGAALLVVSALIVLYASVAPASSAIIGAIVVASLGLAAGALLVGTSENHGRAV